MQRSTLTPFATVRYPHEINRKTPLLFTIWKTFRHYDTQFVALVRCGGTVRAAFFRQRAEHRATLARDARPISGIHFGNNVTLRLEGSHGTIVYPQVTF